VVGRDHTRAQRDSARATEVLTIILVIALLVIIYRAPLLALIPLATVYVAVQLSLNVLAIMARGGWITLFRGIEIYITILAYGAGVDYCLFLTARYKEELDRFHPADAVARAVQGVGAALVASAATVICGIAMMMFAEFGKFRQAGFVIPLSLAAAPGGKVGLLALAPPASDGRRTTSCDDAGARWPARPARHPRAHVGRHGARPGPQAGQDLVDHRCPHGAVRDRGRIPQQPSQLRSDRRPAGQRPERGRNQGAARAFPRRHDRSGHRPAGLPGR
ncbi:MAG: hypothetical protein E6K70_23720, partial [Planctomycetota bacterium]